MHTNKTPHYDLPQFIGSDVPNILTDFNDAVDVIDTALYEIKEQADQIDTDVTEEQNKIADLQTQANLTDDNVTVVSNQTAAARAEASQAQKSANDNAANIAALKTAINNNTSALANYNTRFNGNVPFKFGIAKVEDPDNPGTMIEKYGYYTNDNPAVFVAFGEAQSGILEYIATVNSDLNTGVDIDISSYHNATVDNFLVIPKPDAYHASRNGSSWGSAPSGNIGWGCKIVKTITGNTLNVISMYCLTNALSVTGNISNPAYRTALPADVFYIKTPPVIPTT